MRPVDLRLAVPVAVAWVATIALVGLPEAQVPSVIVLWPAAGIAVVVAFRVRAVAVVALCLAAAAGCASSVALQQPGRSPTALEEAVSKSARVTVTVEVTSIVMPESRSWQADARVIDSTALDVPVIVFGGTPAERTEIGALLTLSGRVDVTEPGDDRAYILFPDAPAEVVRGPPDTLAWAGALRAGFLAAAEGLPGSGGDLLTGLAIGDTTAVTDELDAAMKTSSLSHLTAVSGANCAVVIGLVMLAGGAIGISRGLRIALSLATLVAFVVLVTPEPSVLRAATMAAIVLLLLALGQPVKGVPVLSLAVLGLMLFDPWLSRTYGFSLSVLATAGLLLVASPLAERLAEWMPRPLAFVIAIPAAAQLACQPVVILLDPTLPTYGVIANILAAPAAPVATVIGLAACVLLAFVPPVGQALCSIAWVPAAWIASVAEFFDALPGARLPWWGGGAGVVALAVVSVLVVVLAVGSRRPRRIAAMTLALALFLYGATAITLRAVEVLGRPGDWQVAACDVGQGDAVLLRSRDSIALIDTGRDPALLKACLDDLGLGRIDLLVLTHFDHDHVGGAAEVVGRVDRVLVGPSGSAEDDELVQQFAAAGARVDEVARGQSGLLGQWRWTVLWPEATRQPEPGNAASVVTSWESVTACTNGCLDVLMLGDLGEGEQRRLASLGTVPQPDVVGVAHHGSGDQYRELYSSLAATVGVIGVGADNGYGHPTPEALAALTAAGTTPARTDLNGLILVAPGEERGQARLWTQRQEENPE